LNLMIGGGKTGQLYLLNRASLGGFNSTTDNVVQSFAAGGQIFGSPVLWSGTNAQYLYIWPASAQLKQFPWNSSTGVFHTTPLAIPSSPARQLVSVTGITSSTVSLTWKASTDNVGVAGYDVYRTSQGNTALAGQTGASTLAFTDSNLRSNVNYSYTVKAFDQAGNLSARSNSVKAKTTK